MNEVNDADMVKLIRKTVTIHPSVDKIIRLIQIRLIKLGYDYDYSAALNGVRSRVPPTSA